LGKGWKGELKGGGRKGNFDVIGKSRSNFTDGCTKGQSNIWEEIAIEEA